MVRTSAERARTHTHTQQMIINEWGLFLPLTFQQQQQQSYWPFSCEDVNVAKIKGTSGCNNRAARPSNNRPSRRAGVEGVEGVKEWTSRSDQTTRMNSCYPISTIKRSRNTSQIWSSWTAALIVGCPTSRLLFNTTLTASALFSVFFLEAP